MQSFRKFISSILLVFLTLNLLVYLWLAWMLYICPFSLCNLSLCAEDDAVCTLRLLIERHSIWSRCVLSRLLLIRIPPAPAQMIAVLWWISVSFIHRAAAGFEMRWLLISYCHIFFVRLRTVAYRYKIHFENCKKNLYINSHSVQIREMCGQWAN